MTEWTRAKSAELTTVAFQAGLTPDEAVKALMIGARMVIHGFSSSELDEMVMHIYRVRAEDEAAVEKRTANPTQMRRYYARMKGVA